jgi:quinol monooxygenase YgiN
LANIVVVSRIRIKQGRRQAAIDALREELTASHEEAGVLKFALHEDPDDPANLLVIEVYRRAEDIESHYKQPHFTKLFAQMGELFDGVPTADRYVSLPAGDPVKGQLA